MPSLNSIGFMAEDEIDSLEKAEERLRSNLSKVYSGLNSNNKIDQVEIDVSLLKDRSITINIVVKLVTFTLTNYPIIINI